MLFDLLKIAEPNKFHFHFKCQTYLCEFRYDADIETEGELGICKAMIASHMVSHLRPL